MNQEAKTYVSNVPLQPWSHVRVWLFSGSIALILFGYAQDPEWVERAYVEGWGSFVASGLSRWTSVVPFSVAEVAIGLAIIAEVLWFLTALSEVGAKRRQLSNAIMAGLAHLLDLTAVLVSVFYIVWGVSYARAPAIERLGWTELVADGDPTPQRIDDLRVITRFAQDQMHEAYRELHGRDDAGAVTTPREGLDVDASLDRAFLRVAADLQLGDAFGAPRGPIKHVMASELMSWMGIGGVYIPYTGEANLNVTPPAWSQVFTAAHEKGHQRMIASEDEASFFGFLACVHSDEPMLRYAGWSFAWRQLRRALAGADPTAVAGLDALVLSGPARDRQALIAHWTAYEGWLEELSDAINDQYLKANKVEGGVLAYGRAGRLVAAYLHSEPGRARFGASIARTQARVAAEQAALIEASETP